MSYAKVWIVMLNWNGASETLQCLETLRASNYLAHILVIDNASHDESVTRIATLFPQVEVLAMGENVGFSRGVNAGIARALAAGADYILLLNNDTRVAPNMLTELVSYAEAHPNAGLLSPLIYQLDHPERFWVVGGRWKVYGLAHEGWDSPDHGQYDAPTTFDIVFGTALLIRRSVVETIGYFDERFFVYYEDVDFALRARRAGFICVVVPAAQLWHTGSFSTRKHLPLKEYYLARSRILLFRKHLPGFHFVVYCLIQLRADIRTVSALLRQGQIASTTAYVAGSLSGLTGHM